MELMGQIAHVSRKFAGALPEASEHLLDLVVASGRVLPQLFDPNLQMRELLADVIVKFARDAAAFFFL